MPKPTDSSTGTPQSHKHLSLRLKVAACVAILILFFGAIATVGTFYLFRSNILRFQKDSQVESNTYQALEINQIFLFAQRTVATLAKKTEVVDFLIDHPQDNEAIVQFLEECNVGEIYSAIYLIGPDGITLASTDRSFEGQDYGFRDYFQKAIAGQPYVDVAVGVTSKQLGYYFSQPVYDKAEIIGVLVGKLKPGFLDSYIIGEHDYTGGHMMFTDNYGVILASDREDRIFSSLGVVSATLEDQAKLEKRFPEVKVEPLSYEPLLKEIFSYSQPGSIDFMDHDDEEHKFLSYAKIGEYPFFLIYEKETKNLEFEALKVAGSIAVLVILCALAALVAISFLVNHFLKPLSNLKEAAENIQKGNFDVDPGVRSGDELESLSQTITAMAGSLKGLYQNLEAKVKERTQELEKFKMAVENASDHIVITDSEGIVIYANQAVERITGYNHQEVVGQKAGKVWGNLMDKDFYQKMWQTIKTDKQVFTGEIKNKRKNGEEYYVSVSIAPVLDELGEVIFFVGVERDITREKEVERMKDEFVSVASHELRTPMTAIKGFVSMILEGDYGKVAPKLKEPLSDIAGSTERLIHLVNDLLNLSRIEAGRLKYTLEEFDPGVVINEVVKMLSPIAQEKGLELSVKDIKSAKVFGDKDKLSQVLNNVIGNSLKFTQQGGITVTAQVENELFKILISDTGIGIAKEDQEKIFGKFQQITSAQAGRPAGTGLGLYISKQIASRLGGDLWIENSEVGKGSTFGFSTPLAGSSLAKKSAQTIAEETKEHPDQKEMS